MYEKVWGYRTGNCAWCLDTRAVDSYIDEEAGGNLVSYQVCIKCKDERSEYVSIDCVRT